MAGRGTPLAAARRRSASRGAAALLASADRGILVLASVRCPRGPRLLAGYASRVHSHGTRLPSRGGEDALGPRAAAGHLSVRHSYRAARRVRCSCAALAERAAADGRARRAAAVGVHEIDMSFDEVDELALAGDAPSGSLDAVLDLEDAEMAAGYAEGEAAAAADSRAEGARAGAEAGFAYGHEVGFYAGCARVWRELLLAKADADANGDSSSSPKRPRQPPRQKAALAALEAALRALPMEATDASLHDRLADCRGRFRQAVAAFGVQADAVQPPVRAEIGGAEERASF